MDFWHIPVIDQHAHNLLKPEAVKTLPYAAAFTESDDPIILQKHAATSLFFRRSLRNIAELLSCDASEKAIIARRRDIGFQKLVSLCFQTANLSTVYLDDGFLPGKILPWDWHQQFVPVRRILRLECLAESLIEQAQSFDDFTEEFQSKLDPPSTEVVAIKSIAAYRSGLKISSTSLKEARSAFGALKNGTSEGRLRLSNKPLIDFLVFAALRVAARLQIPVQFHTGFGDPDLDLRLANPLHLRPILEEPTLREAPIVLLHAGYPFVREAAYLAAMYSRVYVDIGLTVPFLSVAGMKSVLRQLLEIVPTSKLMFSSDARMLPELFYLGAKWGREVLADVLEETVLSGDLTYTEAEMTAERVLLENAKGLYED